MILQISGEEFMFQFVNYIGILMNCRDVNTRELGDIILDRRKNLSPTGIAIQALLDRTSS